MNITNLRIRYTQFFLIFILGISLCTMILSLSSGIAQFKNTFWNQNFLIASFTGLRLKLGDRVFQQGIIGKQGWMDYLGDNNLNDYQNVKPISLEQLQILQQKIQKLYEILHKKNITLLIFIAPNKATIYPDKLPDEIQKLNQESNLDRFTAYMKQHGPPVLVDVRPALLNGRKKQEIYFRTDTHWNIYGAFIAYTEIMKALSKDYPQLTAKSTDDFNIKSSRPQLLGITKLIGATNIFEPNIVNFIPKENDVQWITLNDETKSPLQVATTPQENLPILLMYMDSFGIGMKNLMSYSFYKSTFIQNDSKYRDLVSQKTINLVNPNIVILEFVERNISNGSLGPFLDELTAEKK